MRGVILLHHHRHAAAFEVEGYLIHLLPAFRQPAGGIQLNPVQHRGVEQVFQAGLVVAVERAACSTRSQTLPETSVWFSSTILSPGQGAGFISAEDVHRAEILNGVEVLHDDLCFDSFTAPRASVEVTIIGSISGVKPTATDSANSAASHQSPLV